ncbi:probable E3 ubiquitin-protein ligase makorin-1 isoform X2 [Acipenser ruthenus]|uniref:probable E3 ubiquitin-protein ligase makorin-1 isoform X2 n=1 Tax=Acipenser ruthenus TaxID=7906 RepID=UPI00274218E8|nr:probable E3 ubiquitin-protein ligase makorin-1 isoform X2 [Acipenser ruthenus]
MERASVGNGTNNKRVSNTDRIPCRHFIHGTCRLGQSCHFSHQLPVWKSSQICKYFQKGRCWFGDRCRYQHVLQADGGYLGSRRGSAPALVPPWGGSAFQNRRGSEPSVQQAHGGYAGSRRGSEPAVTSLASLQRNFERLSTEFEEDEENHAATEFRPMRQQAEPVTAHAAQQTPNTPSLCRIGSMSSSASAPCLQIGAINVLECASKLGSHERHGLPKASSSQQEAAQSSSTDSRDMARGTDAGASASDAYERSKDVMCGICMDKVYEKPAPEDRRFGILPNCSHPFCLGCIVTWRKTKDFQDEVIKSCPQCRVKSTFYIPNKYWVSDPAQKHTLVAKFKERTSKIKCKFYMRHGCCPFRSECIYLHELPQGHRHLRRRRSAALPRRRSSTEESDSEGFHIMQYAVALALLHDDDDVLDDHFSHRRFFEIFLDDSYLDSD